MNKELKKGITVVIGLFGVLILSEVILRSVEPKISIDLRHYNKIPYILDELKTSTKPHKMLFIGNSLTRRGIDRPMIEQAFPDFKVSEIYPDDSSIIHWYWIYKNRILKNKIHIDSLIIPFALNHLVTLPVNQHVLNQLAGLNPAFGDIYDIIHNEHLSFEHSMDLIIAHYSHLFRDRERIQKRIFFSTIPYYVSTIRFINRVLFSSPEKSKSHKTSQKYNYKHLHWLIELISKNNVKLIFIAVPLYHVYPIDPEVKNIFRKNSKHVFFIDARELKLDASYFREDRFHLNPRGAKRFTSFIIPLLKKILE